MHNQHVTLPGRGVPKTDSAQNRYSVTDPEVTVRLGAPVASEARRSAGSTSGNQQSGPAVPRVIVIDPQRDPRWENFVSSHPDGQIYHHPAWLKVLERAYGHQPLCFGYEDSNGRLQGVLPLLSKRGLLTGRTLSSLPHTPVAGALGRDDGVTAALVQAAIERTRREVGTRLQLKTSSATLATLPEGLVRIPWDETYVIDLPDQLSDLRFGNSRNHGRIKWAISKAAKLGVEVRPAETEDELRDWYALYLSTMRWHGMPPRPYRFFQAAWEILRPLGLLQVLLARQYAAGGNRLIAGSHFLMFGRTVCYAFNGRRREDLALRPNDVIQWQAIHDACRAGYRRYDFGEVEENQRGLADFKSKWGAQPVRLYRYYYPAPRGLKSTVVHPEGAARRVANAVWQKMPLNVTARLGDLVYRYL